MNPGLATFEEVESTSVEGRTNSSRVRYAVANAPYYFYPIFISPIIPSNCLRIVASSPTHRLEVAIASSS